MLVSIFLQTLVHKTGNRLGIVFCVHNIAQTMSGTRKGDNGFVSTARIKDFPAHITGNKAVILAVEQQDGNVGICHSLNCAGFLQVKMPEQSGSQPDEGHSHCRRQVHILPADLADDGLRRGIGAVCNDSHPDRKVFILDSLSTGPELELLIENYRELIEIGCPFEEIQERIAQYLKQTHLLFSLESLSNFAKNGRVSPALAAAANILGIRIVGRASNAGELEPLHKSRGEKRAMKQLWECMQESGYAGGKVRIRHSDNRNAAEMLSGEIRSRYPDADIRIGVNRGLCSYYAEKGGVLVGFETQK